MYLADESDRYMLTPPELFPFARPGIDGIHIGYIIHDPNLGPDFSVGYYAPMDFDGVRMVGSNTVDAFDVLFSRCLQCPINDTSATRISKAAAVLGISPSATKALPVSDWGFGPPADGLPPVATPVPKGWRHVMIEDQLGVLAPAKMFSPEQSDEQSAGDVDDWRKRVGQLLDKGYPASALVVLRNVVWGEVEWPAGLTDLMRRAYLDLGRPLLASVAERQGRIHTGR